MLRIAKDLALPHDAVTQTFAVLARKGAGKTYLAAVMAEEFIKTGLPVVVLDPMGAFWGLRSSEDGEHEGLPVTILGGEHGDVPLEPTAGRVIAQFIVDNPGPYVLDMSLFESAGAQDRFATDFAEAIYRLKARDKSPLHLIVDEADSYAPQRPMPGQQRMLGAFEAIVRRGRIRGLGATLITQRPAVLNKNVLTQAECLVTLQITGPQDRAAIDEWVKGNGSKQERDKLVASLASLKVGQAWFWSPSWLGVFKRVQVRKRETFDSSKTPTAAAKDVIGEVVFAPVDLDSLAAQMHDTIEKARMDDPRELRREIERLNNLLSRKPEPEVVEVEKVVEVMPQTIVKALKETASQFQKIIEKLDMGPEHPLQTPRRTAVQNDKGSVAGRGPVPANPPAPATDFHPSEHKLGKAERRIVASLNYFYQGASIEHVAILAYYKWSGGAFRNAVSALRSAGIIEGGSDIKLTLKGRMLSVPEAVDTGEDLLAGWQSKLGKAERMILDVVFTERGNPVPVEKIAEITGYERTGGAFRNAISSLRSHRLVQGKAELSISPVFLK